MTKNTLLTFDGICSGCDYLVDFFVYLKPDIGLLSGLDEEQVCIMCSCGAEICKLVAHPPS